MAPPLLARASWRHIPSSPNQAKAQLVSWLGHVLDDGPGPTEQTDSGSRDGNSCGRTDGPESRSGRS